MVGPRRLKPQPAEGKASGIVRRDDSQADDREKLALMASRSDHEPSSSEADAAWWKKQLGPSDSTSDEAGATQDIESFGRDRQEVEQKLAALEEQQRQARAKLQAATERLTELEEERATTLGEATLAERYAADIEANLEQLRQELARATFQAAIRERDAVLAEASEAAARLAAAIDAIATARDRIGEAQKRLRAIDRRAPSAVPPETSEFNERWRALAPKVEAELGLQLESELVEAAARSPNYLVLQSLPMHLQELARQRQRELRDEKRRELRGETRRN
jgi:chromosome segregation ATPase